HIAIGDRTHNAAHAVLPAGDRTGILPERTVGGPCARRHLQPPLRHGGAARVRRRVAVTPKPPSPRCAAGWMRKRRLPAPADTGRPPRPPGCPRAVRRTPRTPAVPAPALVDQALAVGTLPATGRADTRNPNPHDPRHLCPGPPALLLRRSGGLAPLAVAGRRRAGGARPRRLGGVRLERRFALLRCRPDPHRRGHPRRPGPRHFRRR